MKASDKGAFEKYDSEVQGKWGQTDAYKEYAEKTKHYSKAQWRDVAGNMDAIFEEFAFCMKMSAAPADEKVQGLVKKLQEYITQCYYTCNAEILAGLGQMYVADERFRNNINHHGEGTADFISRAIGLYCKNDHQK